MDIPSITSSDGSTSPSSQQETNSYTHRSEFQSPHDSPDRELIHSNYSSLCSHGRGKEILKNIGRVNTVESSFSEDEYNNEDINSEDNSIRDGGISNLLNNINQKSPNYIDNEKEHDDYFNEHDIKESGGKVSVLNMQNDPNYSLYSRMGGNTGSKGKTAVASHFDNTYTDDNLFNAYSKEEKVDRPTFPMKIASDNFLSFSEENDNIPQEEQKEKKKSENNSTVGGKIRTVRDSGSGKIAAFSHISSTFNVNNENFLKSSFVETVDLLEKDKEKEEKTEDNYFFDNKIKTTPIDEIKQEDKQNLNDQEIKDENLSFFLKKNMKEIKEYNRCIMSKRARLRKKPILKLLESEGIDIDVYIEEIRRYVKSDIHSNSTKYNNNLNNNNTLVKTQHQCDINNESGVCTDIYNCYDKFNACSLNERSSGKPNIASTAFVSSSLSGALTNNLSATSRIAKNTSNFSNFSKSTQKSSSSTSGISYQNCNAKETNGSMGEFFSGNMNKNKNEVIVSYNGSSDQQFFQKEDTLAWCHQQITIAEKQNPEKAEKARKKCRYNSLFYETVLADSLPSNANNITDANEYSYLGVIKDPDRLQPPQLLDEVLTVLATAAKVYVIEIIAKAQEIEQYEYDKLNDLMMDEDDANQTIEKDVTENIDEIQHNHFARSNLNEDSNQCENHSNKQQKKRKHEDEVEYRWLRCKHIYEAARQMNNFIKNN